MRVFPAMRQHGQVLLPMLFVLLILLSLSWSYLLTAEARKRAAADDARLLGLLRLRLLDVVRGGTTLDKRTWSGWLRGAYFGGSCLGKGSRPDCSSLGGTSSGLFGIGLFPLNDLAPSSRPGSGQAVWYAYVNALVAAAGSRELTTAAVARAPALALPEHGITDAVAVLVMDRRPPGIERRQLGAGDLPGWVQHRGGLSIGRNLAPPRGRWAAIRRHEIAAALTPMADAAANVLVSCRNAAGPAAVHEAGSRHYLDWLAMLAPGPDESWPAILPVQCRSSLKRPGEYPPDRACLWPLAWRDTLRDTDRAEGFRFDGCRRRYVLRTLEGQTVPWMSGHPGPLHLSHDGVPC